MDVTLPDGTVVKGIPEGTTKAQLAEKLKAKGFNVPESWMSGRKSPTSYTAEQMAEMKDAARQRLQEGNIAEMNRIPIGVPGVPSLQVDVPVPGAIARGVAGAGKALYDTGRGIGQLFGKVSTGDVAEARRLDDPLVSTTAGKVGNVLGYVGEAVPLALASPAAGAGAAVAAKVGLGGAQGAAQGYVAPYASTGEHVANTLVGGALGAVIPGAGAAAGRVVRGLATPEAKKLLAEGARLTPGEMLGGAFKRAEDKLTSLPIVGGAIRNAQQRSKESFSDLAVNRVLEPLGMKLPKNIKPGRDALMYAQNAVSDVYNRTLNKMSATVDGQFRQDVNTIWNKYAQKLGPEKADELQSFIIDGVMNKLSPSGATKGQIVHEVQSDLGKSARRLMGRELQTDKNLGLAVKELQGSVKGMLSRQNSADLNAAYRSATSAFTNLSKVQKSATLAGSDKSMITPATLNQAVRASDTGAKKAYSQGRVALQDLAEAGRDVISSKVPDSGTSGRLMMAEMLMHSGAGTAAMLGHPAALATTLTAGAASHALYSRLGSNLMARALAPRPSAAGNFLAQLAQSRLASPQNALAFRALAPQPIPQPVPQIPQQ